VSLPYVEPEIRRPEAGLRSGVRIAVDVGSARIGIASCDPGGLLASPLATVRRSTGALAETGSAAEAALDFAEALAGVVAPVPVRLVDERFTTVIAHAALRQAGKDSRQRRGVVDQAAAASLLQGALDAERSAGDAPGEVVGVAHGGAR